MTNHNLTRGKIVVSWDKDKSYGSTRASYKFA